jgi:hypothetical protein
MRLRIDSIKTHPASVTEIGFADVFIVGDLGGGA